MKKILILIILIAATNLAAIAPVTTTIKFGLLKYSGGGDWYANRDTSIPNLIAFCNTNLDMGVGLEQVEIEVGSPEISTCLLST